MNFYAKYNLFKTSSFPIFTHMTVHPNFTLVKKQVCPKPYPFSLVQLLFLLAYFTLAPSHSSAQDSLLFKIQFNSTEENGIHQNEIVKQWITNHRDISGQYRIIVIGHADSDGDSLMNMELSDRRARSVARTLSENNIPTDQITIGVFGENQPLVKGHSNSAKASNRRVEVYLGPKLNTRITEPPVEKIPDDMGAWEVKGKYGSILRFPPNSLSQKSTVTLTEIGIGENSLVRCLFCRIDLLTTLGECLNTRGMVFIDVQLNNQSIDRPNKNAILLVPAPDKDSTMELFRSTINSRGETVWEPIGKNAEIVIENGKPYYRIEIEDFRGWNVDAIMKNFCDKGVETRFISRKNEIDSLYIVYDTTIRTVIKLLPDGELHTEHLYITRDYFPELRPQLYVVSGDQYFVLPSDQLRKKSNKEVYILRKKYFRKTEKVHACPK